MLRLILSFCFLSILTACDPGYAVYLLNNTTEDKEVLVVETEARSVVYIDSVRIADTLSTDFVTARVTKQPITSKDTLKNSYRFVLGKGKTAVLKGGIGRPKADLSDLFKSVIIDKRDTIDFTKDKRVKADRQFMSTQVTATVKQAVDPL